MANVDATSDTASEGSGATDITVIQPGMLVDNSDTEGSTLSNATLIAPHEIEQEDRKGNVEKKPDVKIESKGGSEVPTCSTPTPGQSSTAAPALPAALDLNTSKKPDQQGKSKRSPAEQLERIKAAKRLREKKRKAKRRAEAKEMKERLTQLQENEKEKEQKEKKETGT